TAGAGGPRWSLPTPLSELDPSSAEDGDPGDRLRPGAQRLDRLVPGGPGEVRRHLSRPADRGAPVLDLLLDDPAGADEGAEGDAEVARAGPSDVSDLRSVGAEVGLGQLLVIHVGSPSA